MSLHGTYDDQNIFAKILRGEIPCTKVHEDDHILAFKDINPQAPMWQLVQQQLGTMGQALQPSKENAALHLTRVRTQCVYGVQYAWLEKAMAKAMVIWEGRAKTEAGASPNVAENAEEDPPAVVNHHPGLHDKGTTKPYPPGEKAAGKRAMQWA